MLYIIILITLFTLAVVDYVSKKRKRECVAHLKGPFLFPIIGSVEMVLKVTPQNFFKYGEESTKKYGNVIRAWVLHRLFITSSDVKMNEQLLTSQQHIVKHRNYNILNEWLGTGLLISHGKKWHTRRKVITPTFHFKILEEFVEIFDQQSDIFVERLAERANEQIFNVYPYVCLVALDIIAETAMGTKINAQTDSTAVYTSAVNEMMKLMAWRFIKVHLNSEIIFSILYPHLKKRQTHLIRTMHEFTGRVIQERRDQLQASLNNNSKPNNTDVHDDDDGLNSKKRMALLDLLLQATIDGKPLSNADIQEEVDTFMFEGHDTTTSAMSFALHMISRHPEVQNKMLAEVESVLGPKTSNTPVTIQQLNDLKYTEKVIKETLRLYPSVPIVGRQIETDFEYKGTDVGDGIIPAGAEYLINIFGMARSEKHFENPNDFLPERHENNSTAYNFITIPFSAGPRNCIGQKFAMLEMKMILAKTVRAYELLPLGESVQLEMNIVLRSTNGFQLGMKKRA